MAIQKAKAAPLTRELLDQRLLTIGRIDLEVETVEARMNRRIDTVKAEYSAQLEQLAAQKGLAAQALRVAMEDSRDELLSGRTKSVSVLMGSVGFRDQPDRVALCDGVDTETACQRMEAHGVPWFVRVKREINKPRIAEALAANEIDAGALAALGVQIAAGGEDFWFKIDRASVKDAVEKDRC